MFKAKINFGYKNTDSFLSVFSGWIGILMVVLLGFLGILMGQRMIDRQDVFWNYNQVLKDARSSTDEVRLTEYDSISFRVTVELVRPDFTSGYQVRDMFLLESGNEEV